MSDNKHNRNTDRQSGKDIKDVTTFFGRWHYLHWLQIRVEVQPKALFQIIEKERKKEIHYTLETA